METATKETATKTFLSGQGVKARKYWKDIAHYYRIIDTNNLEVIYMNFHKTKASIDELFSDNRPNFVVRYLMRSNKPCFQESTRQEFNEAKKEAQKIINQ